MGQNLQMLQCAMAIIACNFAKYGLELNYKIGKSQIMPVFCGPGSKKLEQESFGELGSKLSFECSEEVFENEKRFFEITFTKQYQHLGVLKDSSLSLLPEMFSRARSADASVHYKLKEYIQDEEKDIEGDTVWPASFWQCSDRLSLAGSDLLWRPGVATARRVTQNYKDQTKPGRQH